MTRYFLWLTIGGVCLMLLFFCAGIVFLNRIPSSALPSPDQRFARPDPAKIGRPETVPEAQEPKGDQGPQGVPGVLALPPRSRGFDEIANP